MNSQVIEIPLSELDREGYKLEKKTTARHPEVEIYVLPGDKGITLKDVKFTVKPRQQA